MTKWVTHARTSVIKKVERSRGFYDIVTEDSGGFFLKSKYVKGKPPQVGDEITIHVYLGSSIRGVILRGKRLYYLTDKEIEAEREEWLAKREVRKQRDFRKARRSLDDSYDALPAVFQRRISWFRAHNPDFRVDNEAYEMSVCTDAVRIAETLKTPAKIRSFSKASYKRQRELVPDLYVGHSGNSFGCAVHLAHMYVTNPLLVIAEHGAMVPLTGCEEYGCAHPRPADVMAAINLQEVAA